MKGDNPPRQRCGISLSCSQSTEQIRLDREAAAELYYFPGERGSLSPSIPAAQKTRNDSEDEDSIFYFPPIKEENSAPLVRSSPRRPQATQRDSKKPPLSSKEEPSQSQRRRQPNMGLGRANIVNMAVVRPYTLYSLLLLITIGVCFHQAKSSSKQDLRIQDVADERPMKKRRVTPRDEDDMELVRPRVASLKERVEKVAAEARDIATALEELLREIR